MTAYQTYAAALTAADERLHEIDKMLSLLRRHHAPERVGWSEAGELQRLVKELTAITDRLYNRGEYADESR